jgi:Secretion system C-terminal sorting domain/Galactose oxidase, central domain
MKVLISTIITIAVSTTILAMPWTQKANFGGGGRTAAAGFVIGSTAYMGTGSDGAAQYYDLWAFNPTTNVWTQKADVEAVGYLDIPRTNAIGFAVNGKGYIGSGQNTSGILRDLFEYDPVANSWSKKADIPNTIPAGNKGVGLSIGNKGYFLTGNYVGSSMEFWEYDPAANAGMGNWVQKAPLGGGNAIRRQPSSFSIGNKGYVGLGLDENSIAKNTFWEFDPTNGANGTWTAKASLPVNGWGAVGFATSSKGYIGVGVDGIGKKMYEYDPDLNIWIQKADFPGAARYEAVGFAINGNGYIGTGTGSVLSDFWAFDPAAVLPIELVSFEAALNPQKRHVNIQWKTTAEQDNAYFSIERKIGDSDFQEIGQVKSRGDSRQLTVYDLIDKNPQYGISYYRLKQVNSDNTMTYSKIASVTHEKGSKIKIFPTYTEGAFSVDSNDELLDKVSVFSLSGQLQLTSRENNINIASLPTGVYLVQVTTSTKTQFTSKIFKK